MILTQPEDGNADGKLTSQSTDPNELQSNSAESTVENRTAPDELSIDSILETLSNQRRRYIITYLADAEESVKVSNLTDSVAAFENDVPEDEVSPKERKRVYVALYQCHLPMLDDHQVIEFDKANSEVRPHVHFPLVHSNLCTLEDSIARGGDEDTSESGQLVVFTGALMAGGLALLLSSLIVADYSLSGIGIALISAVIAWTGCALYVRLRG